MTRFDVSHDHFLLYHQLWRSLQRGLDSPFRPALPAEIVRVIVRHARLVLLDRTLSAVCATPLSVRCAVNAPTVVSRVWFWAGPVGARDVADIAQVQLVTVSCDQGWTTDTDPVSRTWFDVGVFPLPHLDLPEDDAEDGGHDWSGALDARWNVGGRGVGAEDWTWLVASRGYQRHFAEQSGNRWQCSHFNPCAETSLEAQKGLIFAMDHVLWQEMAAGHIIAVRVCAQYLNWVNRARKGELKVWRYFEPVVLEK